MGCIDRTPLSKQAATETIKLCEAIRKQRKIVSREKENRTKQREPKEKRQEGERGQKEKCQQSKGKSDYYTGTVWGYPAKKRTDSGTIRLCENLVMTVNGVVLIKNFTPI